VVIFYEAGSHWRRLSAGAHHDTAIKSGHALEKEGRTWDASIPSPGAIVTAPGRAREIQSLECFSGGVKEERLRLIIGKQKQINHWRGFIASPGTIVSGSGGEREKSNHWRYSSGGTRKRDFAR
jgi:hypothetical protein